MVDAMMNLDFLDICLRFLGADLTPHDRMKLFAIFESVNLKRRNYYVPDGPGTGKVAA